MKRLALLLVSLTLIPGSAKAEVSVSQDPVHDRYSLVILGGGNGGIDSDPWPTVRAHIPPEWILNPGGGDNVPPDGPPSAVYSPELQTFEVTWARYDGNDYEIVISRWTGSSWSAPEALTDNATDDLDPDIAVAENGETRISYWSPGGVLMITRPVGGSWSAPSPVDVGAKSSTASSSEQAVAYQQYDILGGTASVIYGWNDGSWSSTTLATTTYDGFAGTGDLDVRIEFESGRTWVVWESAALELSWCEIVNSSCASLNTETLSSVDDEEPGRFRIEQAVLAP